MRMRKPFFMIEMVWLVGVVVFQFFVTGVGGTSWAKPNQVLTGHLVLSNRELRISLIAQSPQVWKPRVPNWALTSASCWRWLSRLRMVFLSDVRLVPAQMVKTEIGNPWKNLKGSSC